MAINCRIKTGSHTYAEHWVADQITWIKTGHVGTVSFSGYLNAATYAAGASPVETVRLSIYPETTEKLMDFNKISQLGKNIVSRAYDLLKAKPEFSKSIDV